MLTSSTPNVPYLDGWRGLAIVCVLIGHFGLRPTLGWLGNFGVQLFFALSGYLMAHLLFIKKVGMPDFFARRLARVLPAFAVFVAAMYVYSLHFQAAPYAVPPGELLATLFFLRTYLPPGADIWSGQWPIGHLWSLNVEEHSYVFLAIGAVLTRALTQRWAATAFLFLSVMAVVAFCLYYPERRPAGASLWFLRSECAALGLIAAAAIRVIRNASALPLLNSVPRLLPVLWVLIGAVCISVYQHRGGKFIIAPLCLALAVNYLDCVPGLLKTMLSNPVLRWFGRCSFSLYLWQQPFFLAANGAELARALACALAIGAGVLSFYAIENPLRLALNGAWAKRKARPGPPNDAAAVPFP